MPFAQEFDDVYVAIKSGVTNATSSSELKCFRADEARPAGRITDRLLQELKTASLCVADLTGTRPNVMWELGFAMAMGCPTIIVTQTLADLPFDIRDMQSLEYDRNRLSTTLSQPLQRVVVDTLSIHHRPRPAQPSHEQLVGDLLTQVSELKTMVAQAVGTWSPASSGTSDVKAEHVDLTVLEGAWINEESGSHGYAKVIKGDLVAPYCYRGNGDITGVYYGWRRVGSYWFARYAWLGGGPAGFTFLKHESVDELRGAWWDDELGLGQGRIHDARHPTSPPDRAGVPATWRRIKSGKFPHWAVKFLEEVERRGPPTELPSSARGGP